MQDLPWVNSERIHNAQCVICVHSFSFLLSFFIIFSVLLGSFLFLFHPFVCFSFLSHDRTVRLIVSAWPDATDRGFPCPKYIAFQIIAAPVVGQPAALNISGTVYISPPPHHLLTDSHRKSLMVINGFCLKQQHHRGKRKKKTFSSSPLRSLFPRK